jgi:hypothetical protein
LRPRSKITNLTDAEVGGLNGGNAVLDCDDDLDYVDLKYDLSDEDDNLDVHKQIRMTMQAKMEVKKRLKWTEILKNPLSTMSSLKKNT